jgi:hypothetical protein
MQKFCDVLSRREAQAIIDNIVGLPATGCNCQKPRCGPYFVTVRVIVRDYPDATLAVFHGPRLLARL